MYRYLFRFVITTLTILTANLLTTAISNYMVSFRNNYKPLTFTIIGMAITVIVFYPLFLKMEDWVTAFSMKLVRSGKSLAGKYMGLILTFAAGMLVLICFYSRMWYHIDILRIIISGDLKSYF